MGYNLRRKVILHAVWALVAGGAVAGSDVLRIVSRRMPSGAEFVRHVGEIWLIVGIGALLFRTVHLFFLKDVQTGLVWADEDHHRPVQRREDLLTRRRFTCCAAS